MAGALKKVVPSIRAAIEAGDYIVAMEDISTIKQMIGPEYRGLRCIK